MTAPTEVLPYVQTALTSGQCSAVMTQNPSGTWALSVDVGPGAAVLGMPALQGNQGTAGRAQFPLRLMADLYDSSGDLPAIGTLTDTPADIGKYWIIYTLGENGECTSTGAYIWFGTEYRFLPFGSQGPPGKYPVIVPLAELLGPDEQSQPVIAEGGTGAAANPYLMTMQLSIPTGPSGPSCALAHMVDVDISTPPLIGEFLTHKGATVDYGGDALPVWSPAEVGALPILPYSVPQAAFTAQFGITFESIVTIASFTIPPAAWPTKPIIFGQIEMFELELSFAPLQIGIEVRLGSPTGTLVARGFGNTLSGVVTLIPHCSSPSEPTKAMTPGNDVALIPQNTTGPASTLYVNVINDGIIAIYDYNPSNAEMFILQVPATGAEQLQSAIPVALNTKVVLAGTVTYQS